MDELSFYRDDGPTLPPPGTPAFVVIRRPRKHWHWLRHLPWLRRYAWTTETYSATITR